ncbi:hypothetical protein DWW91_11525 [Parabacteroides sp. AF17-3]|uniref:hypothetical protein n=1 Tax=Parabacteroides sp. AF17-3 TaxID=2293113 RepID=UPI000F002FB3|nr:hypothetical protein [Parabacteroides sp. AF17-3]RKU69615.1 hypothetical protein DWW91_11525 [Parabacteroides sp. AF17-3]
MSKSKEYKAIKNYIHNDLGISKQILIDIIKEEVRKIVIEVMKSTYGANNVESIVKQALRQEILGNRSEVGWAFEIAVREMMQEIVKSEFKISIVHNDITK